MVPSNQFSRGGSFLMVLFFITACSSTVPYFACCETGGSSTGSPDAFRFTNQTGVNLNIGVTSSTVTVTGFTGTLPVICAGCIGILRNGILDGNSCSVAAGDTLAIVLTSAQNPNSPVAATVTVGAYTSPEWTVTTSANTPNAFSFTNQTGVDTSEVVESNLVTLSGSFTNQTATCEAGVWEFRAMGERSLRAPLLALMRAIR
jgi:hypothetical protein